jgi:hypothetical protein
MDWQRFVFLVTEETMALGDQELMLQFKKP